MTNRFFRFSNRAMLILFNIFFFLALIFAITSPNLILGDNKITGAGTTMVTTFFIVISIVLILSVIVYPKARHYFLLIFVKHQKLTAAICLALVVCWQIIFVLNVHPAIGFDVGAIHEGLINTQDIELRTYFGLYYNNMALLLIQHALATLFSTTSWLFFDLMTLLVVDLSAVLILLTILLLDKKRIPLAMYIESAWLLLFPTIIIPYTDAWVLPFVSGYLLCYVALKNKKFKLWQRSVFAILFGLLVAGTYFMKPSAIAPVIAIVLIEVIYWTKDHQVNLKDFRNSLGRNNLPKWGLLLLCVVALGAGYFGGKQVTNNQNYIVVNRLRAVPAIHFISMGVSGDGGYNPKDALKMGELPTVKARSDYSKKLLVKRLKKLGPVGYAKFLILKHRNNTADGTFAWVKEGHFINENPTPQETGFSGFLRQFVYLYGTHLGDFRYISQVWWVFLLGLVAFGWHNKQKMTQLFRLAILGGFAYLLLFEGGRSRYLIQYLPVIILLATMVANDSRKFFVGLSKIALREHNDLK